MTGNENSAAKAEKSRQAVGFHISENDFKKRHMQAQYPPEQYPIYISISYKGEDFYNSMKQTLGKIPKDKARHRHEDYYGTRFEIFIADTDTVRAVINDKALKECAAYTRKAMIDDERILPHQILDKARDILSSLKSQSMRA